MTRITKAMKKQFKRYRKAYGPMTDEECLEMWDYDNNWCNSDEDAQEWLRNHMLHGEIEEKEIQERFAKKEKWVKLDKRFDRYYLTNKGYNKIKDYIGGENE